MTKLLKDAIFEQIDQLHSEVNERSIGRQIIATDLRELNKLLHRLYNDIEDRANDTMEQIPYNSCAMHILELEVKDKMSERIEW